jgi:uncharacterized membrane protein
MSTEPWAFILVIIAAILGGFGGLYFKLGADKLKFNIKDLIKNWRLMLGVLFYGTSTIFFIASLKGGDVTVIYPFASLTYVCVVLLSIKLLKEKMNLYKWIGIISIIAGVALIGIGG